MKKIIKKIGSVKYIKRIIKFFTKTRMQIKFTSFKGFQINMNNYKDASIVGKSILIVKKGFKTKICINIDEVTIKKKR